MVAKRVSPSARQLVRLACVCLIGVAGFATAKAAGTPAQRIACAPDAYRLCADEIPDVAAIAASMIVKRSRLSAACRSVF